MCAGPPPLRGSGSPAPRRRSPLARPRGVVVLLAIAAIGCVPSAERGLDCLNDRDDDGDGLIDCADPGCGFEPLCGNCGNGEVDPGEVCDDGNLEDGDDCTSRCLNPKCGNGEPDGDEECDDGNVIPADGCNTRCELDRCGDRIVQRDLERCEDGNLVSGDGCDAHCNPEPLPGCGNSEIAFDPVTFEQLEECDDGNRQSGDGCSSQCKGERCGDGIVQPLLGEQCETADPNATDLCSGCRVPLCGDGFTTPDEQCDDGNTQDQDFCSATCRFEFCGDGIVQPALGEQCDDANSVASDGCDFCFFR